MANPEKITLRKTIIKLHRKGKTGVEISELLDISQSTVSFWIVRWRKTGILEDKLGRGMKSKLVTKQFTELKKILLDCPPPRFGGKSMGWTTKMAIQYIFDTYGVKYSMRRMQELFHKIGLNLITPRTEHIKSSYAARTVYRMDFKKNSKTNIWIAPSLISMKQPSD